MSYGRPGPTGTHGARWLHDRLLATGLVEDQLVATAARPPARLTQADLEPAHYLPDLAPLVRRMSRLMGGARGLSVFVTGARGEESARRHTALQLALGLAPMGREVVLVDTDFLRSGLGGLIADPLADGVTDMARFGRSSRSLLLKPVPEGPWLLPSGSFPEDDPVPLEPDALRSVVYRISQVCHLALYVGPLPIRSEVHPLARICDHVVYTTLDESPEASAACTEAVRTLQTGGAHLLGVVSYAVGPTFQPGRRESVPLPAAQPSGRGIRPVSETEPPVAPPREVERPATRARAVTPRLPAFLQPTAEPRVTPTAPGRPGREQSPEPAAPPASSAPPPAPAAKPTPDVGRPPAGPPKTPPAVDFPRVDLPTLPDAAGASQQVETPSKPEPEVDRNVVGSRITKRAPDEEAQVAPPPSGFTSAEYALEEERGGHGSALLVIAVIVVALGFLVVLGPRLLERWRDSRNPTTSQTGVSPETSTSETPEPNDRAAATGQEPAPSTTPGDQQATGEPGAVPPETSPAGGASSGTPATETPTTSGPTTSPGAPATETPTTSGPTTSRGTPATETPTTSGPTTSPGTPSTAAQGPPTTPPASSTSQPSPARSSPATGPAAEDYGVHLASYRTLAQAQVEIRSLEARGFAARAIRTDLGERGIWYRVVAGPYATRDEAEKARAELLKLPEYKYAQVRRVPRD